MTRPPLKSIAALALLLLAAALAGCSGGSSTVAEGQLREARKEGEEAARQRDRLDDLQKQVRSLRHQVRHATREKEPHSSPPSSSPPDAPPAEPASQAVRAFHVASENVSCEILEDGAVCTVEPIGQSFSFSEGQPAGTESAATLPRGLGELVPYGSTVSAGSISCEIPPSSVPRGVTCLDASSGHGFEASRVPSRQDVY
jgi:hypothetical protein